jgi:hypothetical protein
MSSWHYQIMRHTADSGDDYLAIHEFYWTDTKQEAWTAKPVPIEADSIGEMRMALLATSCGIWNATASGTPRQARRSRR